MEHEPPTLVRDRRVRWWMTSQYAAFVIWIGIVSALTAYGLDLLFVIVVGLVTGLGFGWFLAPSRGWWGPGPEQVMADPSALRRYRRRTLVVFVASVVLVPLVVGLAFATFDLWPA